MVDVYSPTVDEVRSVLTRAGESADSAEVVGLTPIRHGAVGGLLEVERAGADPLVLKIYPDELVGRMRTEAYVYRLLSADASIPVPRVLASDESRTALPFPYLVMSKLSGVRLADLGEDLSDEDGAEIFAELGAVLRRIHRVAFDVCGPIVDGALVGEGSNAEFLGRLFDEQCRDFGRFGGPAWLGEELRRYVDRRRDSLDIGSLDIGGGGVLCHNDYVPGNLHVRRTDTGWRVCGVVDVERAIVADPLFDVARISRSSRWAREFVDGYGVPEDGPPRLRLYELFHTLELRNWFSETGWVEQLPHLDRELTRRIGA